jgi:hypothetical protein
LEVRSSGAPVGAAEIAAGAAGDGSAVAAEFAGHLDVAAEGEDGDAVVGAAVAEAEEAGAEADGEGFDADAAELGDDEVAELMDEDEDAEDDGEFDDDEEKMHEERSGNLRDYRQMRSSEISLAQDERT